MEMRSLCQIKYKVVLQLIVVVYINMLDAVGISYSANKFPDPRGNNTLCGVNRENGAFMCDPAGILSATQVTTLSRRRENFRHAPRCVGCSTSCTHTLNEVMVAIVPRIQKSDGSYPRNNEDVKILTENFAQHLAQGPWSIYAQYCRTLAVVVYDNYTKEIAISTNRAAKNILNDTCVGHIINLVKGFSDIEQKLVYIIDNITTVLNTGKCDHFQPQNTAESNKPSTWSVVIGVVVVLGFAGGMFLMCLCCDKSSHRKPSRDTNNAGGLWVGGECVVPPSSNITGGGCGGG